MDPPVLYCGLLRICHHIALIYCTGGDMRIFSFIVDGIPVSQPRCRPTTDSKLYKSRVYDPGNANDWKNLVILKANRHLPKTPFSGPVKTDITFLMPRPKYMNSKKYPEGFIPHLCKPDKDNLEKAVLDSLTNCGFWKDDSQVCSGSVHKFYHEKNGRPRALIRIAFIDEPYVEKGVCHAFHKELQQ